ncbi:hypothetical protein OG864_41825 [Streptomyces sp. NBC_00124]|uniref:hypothetical protein n=1 Tax=Streptomyces sp. NBC_00124 TaxID=2975662 RepID=UPI00225ADCB2|nr:hypothetical protein [Streptomyces sp. NBC_00124]MCX5365232.1 hypothetical protein [Streptomyces sp. NBC_00124]
MKQLVAELALSGDLARPARLTVPDLLPWPQHRAHRALLSWAEIDPDFAHAPVLLAVSIDEAPLDRAGPQLVLPQDRCGARYVSGVTGIRVDGGYEGWA